MPSSIMTTIQDFPSLQWFGHGRPESPNRGDWYWDTEVRAHYIWDGSSWISIEDAHSSSPQRRNSSIEAEFFSRQPTP